MYSESRVTRSKARSQGVSQFEELPLTSAKGRTTTKKPRERPAFFDVSNAERAVSGEILSSPIKNLTADFEPAKIQTHLAEAPFTSASLSYNTSELVESEDTSVPDTALPQTENEPAPLLHKAPSAETDIVPVPQALYPGSAPQSSVQPVTGVLSTYEDSFGDQGGTASSAQELTVTADTIVEEDDSEINAVTPLQAQQSPVHKSIEEALPSLQGIKDDEFADPAFSISYVDEAPTPEHDTVKSTLNGTPQKPAGNRPSVSTTLSSTPVTAGQPLSNQSTTPDVPDTVIARPDAGHLIADSLTPKAQPTPVGAASATAASPNLAMRLSPIPGAGGLLDASYFSTEAGPEMTDEVNESARDTVVLRTSSPDRSAVPYEERLQGIDIIDAVYLSEPDADSAEHMGELAPFEHMGDSPSSPHSSAVSDNDTRGASDIMQSPLTPKPPPSPASGVAYTPALDSTMASDAFGSPMQEVPGSAARTAVSSGTVYRASPAGHDNDSLSGSTTEEEAKSSPGGESHMMCYDTEGSDDRWQLEEEAAPVVSNICVAKVPASRVSSQVHASPSYDPRSLKQLRKEVADKLAKKAAAKAQAEMAAPPPTPAGLYESESDVEMSPGLISTKQPKGVDDDELCDALESLEIQSVGKSKEPLRGLPVPQGMHIRFDDDGGAMSSPSTTQTRLRGVPAPRNSHIRFD